MCYVVFGRTTGFPAVFELRSLGPAVGGDGSAGFIGTGAAAGDHAGFSVSGAGDVNGDGVADAIIGAYGVDAGGPEQHRRSVRCVRTRCADALSDLSVANRRTLSQALRATDGWEYSLPRGSILPTLLSRWTAAADVRDERFYGHRRVCGRSGHPLPRRRTDSRASRRRHGTPSGAR
jgi:hypothetical protein